jgi:hypothetical protein
MQSQISKTRYNRNIMKKETIKRHFKHSSILQKRKTTIAAEFAYAIAPIDIYDETRINKALEMLQQDPHNDLNCVYCSEPAKTWDHLFSLVKNGELSGPGHQIGNLVPCCKDCNSKKGGKDYKEFIKKECLNEEEMRQKIEVLDNYSSEFTRHIVETLDEKCSAEMDEYRKVRSEIYRLMGEADKIASQIREKSQVH